MRRQRRPDPWSKGVAIRRALRAQAPLLFAHSRLIIRWAIPIASLGLLVAILVAPVFAPSSRNSDYSSPPSLYFAPQDVKSYANAIGERVSLTVTESGGSFLEQHRIIGTPPITIEATTAVAVPRSTCDGENGLDWTLKVPPGTTDVAFPVSNEASHGTSTLPDFHWGAWRELRSGPSITVPVICGWKSDGQGAYVTVYPRVRIRLSSLTVGYTREGGAESTVNKLEWSPPPDTSMPINLYQGTTPFTEINWTTPPQSAVEAAQRQDIVQLSVCPSCLGLAAYDGQSSIGPSDVGTWAVISQFNETKLLSWTQPNPPWSWLLRYRTVIVEALASTFAVWLLTATRRRNRQPNT